MLRLIIQPWSHVALEERRLKIHYLQAEEAIAVAAPDGLDGPAVVHIRGQFGQLVVVVAQRGYAIVVPKYLLYLTHWCLTKDHQQLLTVLHPDYRVLLHHPSRRLDILQYSALKPIGTVVELLRKSLQPASQKSIQGISIQGAVLESLKKDKDVEEVMLHSLGEVD
jgi:hypothetical protein